MNDRSRSGRKLTVSDLPELASLRRNDERALQALRERHLTAVYWYASSILRSPQEAEEIAADAFVTLWVKRHRIEIYGESLLPWLIVTTRNLSWSRRRKTLRRKEISIEALPEMFDAGSSPEEEVEQRAAISSIMALLGRQDPIDQQIFTMCMIDGLTYKEAARKLQVSHGVVRNRLHRVRKQLQSLIRTA